MQQCPTCEVIYEDETLIFCTADGAALVAPFNRNATYFNTPIPPSVPAPTEASNDPTPSTRMPPYTSVAEPRSMFRPLTLGALVIAALLGGAITVWLLQKPNPSSSNQVSTTATPIRTPTLETKEVTPTPSPLATATPKTSALEPECMLYNDKADRSGVITRSDCDIKDCESDSSTIGDEYPDKTPIRVFKGSNVKGKRFTWVKVFLLESKATVWVAASKVRC